MASAKARRRQVHSSGAFSIGSNRSASSPSRFHDCSMCGGKGAVASMMPPRGCGITMRRANRCSRFCRPPGSCPVFLVEIFGIADDGVIDMRHVRAQLMGPPGDRLQRYPGQLLRRGFHHCVIGHGVARALVAMRGDAHDGIVLALFLGEIGRDAALLRLRHAGDQRPVDLARRTMAERSGQRGRGETRLRDQEAARRLLVEPVHQARLLPLGIAHRLQHLVDMPRGAGAALHRKPRGLVQHHDVGVLIQRSCP